MERNGNTRNPFLLSGYVSPEYFCDREKETERLISALRNGRNITLVSPRRMGKTGLIRHAFHAIGQQGHEHCYLIDLYQTDSLTSLVSSLARVVLGSLDTKGERLMKTVGTFFKSLRPTFSIDTMTGRPEIEIDVQPNHAEQSLVEIFNYMEHSGKQCFVAFDEFQRVAEYDDSNIEALLRSHIQQLSNVHFVFSGSQRHVLENMFASAKRPFYQSTQIMNLDCVDAEAYYSFAAAKLEGHEQQISRDVFLYMYNRLHGHTWYIQAVLNRLFEKGISEISQSDIDETLHDITEENEATFQTMLRMITPAQRKLLRAVAKEVEVEEITGKTFLSAYHLGAASTINAATRSLVDKELLLDDNGRYSVYDRFLALYLE